LNKREEAVFSRCINAIYDQGFDAGRVKGYRVGLKEGKQLVNSGYVALFVIGVAVAGFITGSVWAQVVAGFGLPS